MIMPAQNTATVPDNLNWFFNSSKPGFHKN